MFDFTLSLIVLAGLLEGDAVLPPPPRPADFSPPAGTDTATKTADKDEKKPVELAPFGIVHDFGKLRRGTIANHVFRIVNTSEAPLRVVRLRTCGPLTADWSTSDALQPNRGHFREAELRGLRSQAGAWERETKEEGFRPPLRVSINRRRHHQISGVLPGMATGGTGMLMSHSSLLGKVSSFELRALSQVTSLPV